VSSEVVVFLSEDLDWDADGDSWWLGTFSGSLQPVDPDATEPSDHFHGLSLDDALAWSRARAARVLLRVGDLPEHEAGEEAPSRAPRWPPETVPPLGRRRIASQTWKDRTEDDPDVEWQVELGLVPPEGWSLTDTQLPGRAEEARALADRAGAHAVSDDAIEGFLTDIRAARDCAGGTGPFTWSTIHSPQFLLRFHETAPTVRQAVDAARGRLTLPDGWEVVPGRSQPSAD
jgi:hypothetical protein